MLHCTIIGLSCTVVAVSLWRMIEGVNHAKFSKQCRCPCDEAGLR